MVKMGLFSAPKLLPGGQKQTCGVGRIGTARSWHPEVHPFPVQRQRLKPREGTMPPPVSMYPGQD